MTDRRPRGRAALQVSGAAVLLVALCALGQPAEAASAVPQKIETGGTTRSYLLYEPATLARGPVPLVIAFHGAGGSPATTETKTRFDAQADKGAFVVAYPQGDTWSSSGYTWHVGCCDAIQDDPNDVTFISDLINQLVGSGRVDARRVYVVGSSVGSMMAYRLGCELPGRIAGIGSSSGTMIAPCQTPAPVSVYEIHGTNDYYNGACGNPQEGGGCNPGQKGYEPSVRQLNQRWRDIDGCPANGSSQQSGVVTQERWGPCRNGTSVALDTVQNGTHCWYGGAGEPSQCQVVDATSSFWAFFAGHSAVVGSAGAPPGGVPRSSAPAAGAAGVSRTSSPGQRVAAGTTTAASTTTTTPSTAGVVVGEQSAPSLPRVSDGSGQVAIRRTGRGSHDGRWWLIGVSAVAVAGAGGAMFLGRRFAHARSGQGD